MVKFDGGRGKKNCLDDIKTRISNHFNILMIDEVQDFVGRDFDFLMEISKSNADVFLVGDFYQHTYSTSNEGNKNENLFDDYENYINKILEFGFERDSNTLSKSYRCSKEICRFVTINLKINIDSKHDNSESFVKYVEDDDIKKNIL